MPQHTAIISDIRRERFPAAAFLIALFIRAIPEAIAGQYPIGWDTISFYVPSTLDWAAGKATLQFMFGEAPLIYAISVPLKILSVDPVLTFKVLGPIIYGGLALSVYRFLRVNLCWTERISFMGTIVTSFYYITLRVSWDLYRNELGIMFLLLALSSRGLALTRKRQVSATLLLCLAVLSDQFSAVLGVWIFAVRALQGLRHQSGDPFWRRAVPLLPAVLLLLSILFSESQATGLLFPRQPPISENWTLATSAGFLLFAYLPLLPLAIVGIKKTHQVDMVAWVALSLAGATITSFGFVGLAETGYRWALLSTIPVCIYSLAGLQRLQGSNWPGRNVLGKVLTRLQIVFLAALVVSGTIYTLSTAEAPLSYFTLYPSYVPTSMLQSTIPFSDYSNLLHILDWAGANPRTGAVLITHQAIYGWAREYLSPTIPILNYAYGTPMDGVQMATAKGYSNLLLIWWVNGTGWFGQTSVPKPFTLLYSVGDMALYDFVA